jgi:hypothetical protein
VRKKDSLAELIRTPADVSCTDNCNSQGVCKQGFCECYPGFSGFRCETSLTTLLFKSPNTHQLIPFAIVCCVAPQKNKKPQRIAQTDVAGEIVCVELANAQMVMVEVIAVPFFAPTLVQNKANARRECVIAMKTMVALIVQ